MGQSGETVCDAFIVQSNGNLNLSSLCGLVLSWDRRVEPSSPGLVFPGGSDDKESAYSAGDLGSIPGSGRSPGEGNLNPFPIFLSGEAHGLYIVHGVAKSQTQLSD